MLLYLSKGVKGLIKINAPPMEIIVVMSHFYDQVYQLLQMLF